MNYAHAEQLGSEFSMLQKAGDVNLFGLDSEHLPDKIDISRWYTPEHWGADAATLAARKKGTELPPYEIYFKDSVSRLLSSLSDQYLPVKITGGIEYMINRTKDGWIIGLINNDGVTKDRMGPVMLDPSRKKVITVYPKQKIRLASEWCMEQKLDIYQNGITVEVPSGEVRILEILLEE